MADDGQFLHDKSRELLACIEELKGKRIDLDGQIAEEQSHQASLQTELESLTAEIYTCNQGLSQKLTTRTHLNKIIEETEGAYNKILKSSEMLLGVIRREKATMYKRAQPVQTPKVVTC